MTVITTSVAHMPRHMSVVVTGVCSAGSKSSRGRVGGFAMLCVHYWVPEPWAKFGAAAGHSGLVGRLRGLTNGLVAEARHPGARRGSRRPRHRPGIPAPVPEWAPPRRSREHAEVVTTPSGYV